MANCLFQCLHTDSTVHASGMSRIVCKTHSWQYPTCEFPDATGLCPVGKIEQATKAAIERINAGAGAEIRASRLLVLTDRDA